MISLADRPRRRFWVLQTLGWLAFYAAMAASRVGRYPFDYMVATKGALTVLGLLASLVLWRVYRPLAARGIGVATTIAVCAAASYLVAALWTGAYNVTDAAIARALLGARGGIGSLFALFAGSVYHAFVLFGWSVLYFGIKHQDALVAERERALRAELSAHEARLEALRYQLNPHFLFNSLNAISTLVVEQRAAEAGRMLSRLSDFLRATLEGATSPEISLAEEIDFVRRYLEIEQVRFGDRLAVEFDIDENAWTARVPTLVLQPLVENALRHAVAGREEGGRIVVRARRIASRLELSVSDDGPGVPAGVERVGSDRMPPVIFVTAYDAYALAAFDAHALDYLLKPIDDERFAEAVGRARGRLTERAGHERARRLAALLAERSGALAASGNADAERRDTRLMLRDRGRIVFVDQADVDWLAAEGDYVRVWTGGRSLVVRETMHAMEQRLDPDRFARIHRSSIVNVGRIRELRPQRNREYLVILHGGAALRASRSYGGSLERRFGRIR